MAKTFVSTIGCTAWIVWDVCKATKVILEKLTSALFESADDCEQQCREDVLRRGEELSI